MEMLPPAGWGDVVTRQQLAAFEDRINARLGAQEDRVNARFDGLQGRIDGRFDGFDGRIDGRFDAADDRLGGLERQLRSDVRGDLNEAIIRMQGWTIASILGSATVVIGAVALFGR